MTDINEYRVEGMTCGHCVNAVTQELLAVEGVTEVSVELGTDAPSTVRVTSEAPLAEDRVRAALDEAGEYRLSA